MNEPWFASLMLTAVAVAMSGGFGFNRPGWIRSYTTPARYRMAAAAHIGLCGVFMAMVYVALLSVMRLQTGAWTWSVGALWLALLMTLAMRWTHWWRDGPLSWLHKVAGVPRDAHDLARQLAESRCEIRAPLHEDVRALLQSRGIDADGDWLPLAQPAHRLLSQSTALFLQVRDWERQPDLRVFCMEAKHDLDTLRQRFDRLTFRVSRAFESIEKLGEIRHLIHIQHGLAPRTQAPGQLGPMGDGERDDDIDSVMRRLISQMIADICEDIGIFHREICLITARGLMASARSRHGLACAIEAMGLNVNLPRRRSGYGVLLMTVLAMYVGVSVQSAQLASAGLEMSPAMRAFLITVNVAGALVFAIVPKMHWGFANSGLMRKTPVGFVIGAGLAAAVFAALVNMAVGAMQYGSWDGAVNRLMRGAVYLHMPFLTAATMAWLVQDHRWAETGSRRVRRVFDALVLSAVWLPAWWGARMLRLLVMPPQTPQNLLTQQAVLSALTWVLMALIIGYWLPESVRLGHPRRQSDMPSKIFDVPWRAWRAQWGRWLRQLFAPAVPVLPDQGRHRPPRSRTPLL